MLPAKTWLVSCAFAVVSCAIAAAVHADDAAGKTPKKTLAFTEDHRELGKSEKLQDAISRAYALIEKGVENYPSNRQCFSCHHQTLPLMSRSLNDRLSLDDLPDDFWNDALTQSMLRFTEASFSEKTTSMREGRGVGGKALTVAYGLWAMDLAGAKRNETIDAMIDYLLLTQADDGAWNFQSVRPPAASSRSMTTAIALYGLRAYGPEYVDPNRLQNVFQKTRQWSLQADESESQEELNGLAWIDYMLHEEHKSLREQMGIHDSPERTHREKNLATISNDALEDPFAKPDDSFDNLHRLIQRRDQILRNQNDDGGWGQTVNMPSDAYATGQTLLILAQVEYREKKSIQSSHAFMKGIEFLLESQASDGSWHVATRAKPVQVFFDNGDPYGKDQFISIMATNWAVAALANFQASGFDPLESFQVVHRRNERRRSNLNQAIDPLDNSK